MLLQAPFTVDDPAMAVALEQMMYILNERLQTANLANVSVTSPKRQLLNELSATFGPLGAGSTVTKTFTHNLGVVPILNPLVTDYTGNIQYTTVLLVANDTASTTYQISQAFGTIEGTLTIQFF